MKFKKSLLSISFVFLIALLLLFPKASVSFAKEGLLTWFNTMLPTLMPFMILSTLMISLHLTDFLGPVKYCICMGFLCGFPMGAKVVKDLYEKGTLSREKATDLLGFCNNLGPIFILNFALPTLNITNPLWCLIGFYGVPICYGLILHLLHHDLYGNTIVKTTTYEKKNMHLLYHMDDAIQCAISSITVLGGYMIFFNLLNIIPYAIQNLHMLLFQCDIDLISKIRCLIEISGGLSAQKTPSIWIVCLIPLGGLSCLAQVYSIIKNTDLSFVTYIKHKLVQTLLTTLYFLILTFFEISFF